MPEAQALASKCPLLPGKALAVWMEYMIRFKKIYEASKQRLTPKTEVEDFLAWIHAHEADKLFVPYMFDRFFKGWMNDLDQGREWYYFHEMDWTNEYDRLEKARRGQSCNGIKSNEL